MIDTKTQDPTGVISWGSKFSSKNIKSTSIAGSGTGKKQRETIIKILYTLNSLETDGCCDRMQTSSNGETCSYEADASKF